jgi:hypothetical protein
MWDYRERLHASLVAAAWHASLMAALVAWEPSSGSEGELELYVAELH